MKGLIVNQVRKILGFLFKVINMEKHNFKKKYGQNFLQDEEVLLNIVDSLSVTENDLIIEVGPGAGALTKHLKNLNCQILAYEIDVTLENTLKKLEDDKTKIVFKDFMDTDLVDDLKMYKYDNIYLVANLPYYITTPILERTMESELDFKEVVVMVQDEVAKRLTSNAGNKDFGAFTVLLDCFYERDYLFYVDRKAFYPIPNVDSAVMKLTRKECIDEFDYKNFKKFIFDCFQFKRKNLKNNLKGYDLENISIILEKYSLSLNNRAEEVDTKIFIEIFNSLK